MRNRMEKFFTPDLALVWNGRIYLNDLARQYAVFCQVRKEAGIAGSIDKAKLDAFLEAAGRRGLCVEVRDGPESMEKSL